MTPCITVPRRAAVAGTRGISSDAIYAAILAALEAHAEAGDLLDFGAGACLRALAGRGQFRSLSGIDLMPRPGGLPDSIQWQEADLNDPSSFSDESFDVIISSEVIEHLESLRAVFREWHRLLRPAGVLVCSTPNNESIRSLITLAFRGHFAAFGEGSYPAHITALLRKDLARICGETGFAAPVFSFTNEGGLPGRPAWKWQQVIGRWCAGVRFSDNLVLAARKRR